MSRLLITEDSVIVRGAFKKLLDDDGSFDYDLVQTYAEAKTLLESKRYEYAVVDRTLKDAPNGEIIALFNKHNIAPLVFTKEIDEILFETFEGAKIVDYMKKIKYNNITYVISKLKRLQKNKNTTVLIHSKSAIYSSYLKENLDIHGFKVFTIKKQEDLYDKIDLHPELSLLIIDADDISVDVIESIREKKSREILKILVLVDETNSYHTSSLLSSGADDFIVKQFSRDEFYVRVYQNINKL